MGLLDELDELLKEKGLELPQNVTNRLLLSEVREMSSKLTDIKDGVQANRSDIDEINKLISPSQFGSWSWVREKFGQPVMLVVLIALVELALNL